MCPEDPKTLEATVPEAFTGEKLMPLLKSFVFTHCCNVSEKHMVCMLGKEAYFVSGAEITFFLFFYWFPYLDGNWMNVYYLSDTVQCNYVSLVTFWFANPITERDTIRRLQKLSKLLWYVKIQRTWMMMKFVRFWMPAVACCVQVLWNSLVLSLEKKQQIIYDQLYLWLKINFLAWS